MSTVAHELNNPLTVIAGFAEILLSSLTLNEQDQADLQMIASEANRARQMIYELLGLSREQPPRKQVVDLNQLTVLMLEHHQTDLQTSRIDVVTELACDLPSVSVDPEQLNLVFTYLLNHIRRSLTAGGGRLRVRTTVRQLKIQTGSSQVVQITFSQDGPSRSSDERRQIFEPHYSAREEDHGLGLALAYNFIQQHGGQMYALSSPGKGLTFVIELPVSEQTSGIRPQGSDKS
jgi:signal transduction histidine kinase